MQFPYRPCYSQIIGDAFEIYLRVLWIVNRRVQEVLGQDSPNWRVLNACPPCTYEVGLTTTYTFQLLTVRGKLHDGPELKYRRLICMDGNDSLKRIRTIGQRQTADIRVFSKSDYFIPTEEVDKFANEVRGRVSVKANAVSSDDQQDEWEDVTDDASINPEDTGGDPIDGTDNLVIDGCVHNWKAAQSDSKKRSWEIFEENGLFASACRHGLILWVMDMVWSGEL